MAKIDVQNSSGISAVADLDTAGSLKVLSVIVLGRDDPPYAKPSAQVLDPTHNSLV